MRRDDYPCGVKNFREANFLGRKLTSRTARTQKRYQLLEEDGCAPLLPVSLLFVGTGVKLRVK